MFFDSFVCLRGLIQDVTMRLRPRILSSSLFVVGSRFGFLVVSWIYDFWEIGAEQITCGGWLSLYFHCVGVLAVVVEDMGVNPH